MEDKTVTVCNGTIKKLSMDNKMSLKCFET